MVNGHVRVKPVRDNSIPDAELKQLGEELSQAGFEATFGGPPDFLPSDSPWIIVLIYADVAAKAALGVLVKTLIDWARRRRSERAQLLTIYGPNGEILKRIQVEGDEAQELSTTRPLRKAQRRTWRNFWRRKPGSS